MNSASVTVVPSVLVTGDEPALSGMVKNHPGRASISAQTCGDGLIALGLVRATAPDVVMLDPSLSGMNGVETCHQLRTFSDCCALMLTARANKVDKLIGLSVGASDHIAKPFSLRELVARIQVLLRRPRTGNVDATAAVVYRIGALTLDPSSHRVGLDASPAGLTHTEFDLLQTLAEHPGWVLNRRQFTDAMWGGDWVGDDHLVDIRITYLRKKLDDGPSRPQFMQTVHGVDYRMGQGQ